LYRGSVGERGEMMEEFRVMKKKVPIVAAPPTVVSLIAFPMRPILLVKNQQIVTMQR
jgi:hypothetical protein